MKKNNFALYFLILLNLSLAGFIALKIFCSDSGKVTPQISIHQSSPAELEFFETAFKFSKKEFPLTDKKVTAGIIPHHLLAADLIAEWFYNLRASTYETVILIGPNHFNRGDSDIIISAYDWQTPYGILPAEQAFVENLLKISDIKADEEAVKNEHSITGEVSFIKKIFPEAKILPIILKSGTSKEEAEILADKLLSFARERKILVIASVDFSHYKDSLAAQKDDQVSREAIANYDFDKIYGLELDSPASIYTLLRYSQFQGAKFELLANTNSALLADRPNLESTTSYLTGYFVE